METDLSKVVDQKKKKEMEIARHLVSLTVGEGNE